MERQEAATARTLPEVEIILRQIFFTRADTAWMMNFHTDFFGKSGHWMRVKVSCKSGLSSKMNIRRLFVWVVLSIFGNRRHTITHPQVLMRVWWFFGSLEPLTRNPFISMRNNTEILLATYVHILYVFCISYLLLYMHYTISNICVFSLFGLNFLIVSS